MSAHHTEGCRHGALSQPRGARAGSVAPPTRDSTNQGSTCRRGTRSTRTWLRPRGVLLLRGFGSPRAADLDTARRRFTCRASDDGGRCRPDPACIWSALICGQKQGADRRQSSGSREANPLQVPGPPCQIATLTGGLDRPVCVGSLGPSTYAPSEHSGRHREWDQGQCAESPGGTLRIRMFLEYPCP